MDERPAAVEKAKQLLEEGEKIINERQKHIRIANRSDNGWAMVEEYVEDELADNEDDEKRLLWADAHAGKKLKSTQRGSRGSAKKILPKRSQWNFQGPRNSVFTHVVALLCWLSSHCCCHIQAIEKLSKVVQTLTTEYF